VLLGDKAGDNEQCLAVAEALGWPYDVRRLAYNRRFRRWNVRLGATLASLDRERSDALGPPWPDLVVAVGRRSVPVARWIWQQHGDATRLVQLGGRAPLAWFDLVVTTRRYGLPDRASVVTSRCLRSGVVPDAVASWPTHLPRRAGGRSGRSVHRRRGCGRAPRTSSEHARRGPAGLSAGRHQPAHGSGGGRDAGGKPARAARAASVVARPGLEPISVPARRSRSLRRDRRQHVDARRCGRNREARLSRQLPPGITHRLRRIAEALGPLHRWRTRPARRSAASVRRRIARCSPAVA
jgi:hypothetical protein